MAVLIMASGTQSFIDGEAVNRLARNADTVKRVERGPMQDRYELTHHGCDEPCSIVVSLPSFDADLLEIAERVRKPRKR